MRNYFNSLLGVASALALTFGVSHSAFGQQEFGGKPLSFDAGTASASLRSQTSISSIKSIPMDINLSDFIQQKDWETQNYGAPYSVGYVKKTNVDFSQEAERIALSNGRSIYRLRMRSEGAKEVTPLYSNFLIPEGAKLYVYDPAKKTVHGAYTHATHPEEGDFSSMPVLGDEVIFEYEPNDSGEMPKLVISGLVHNYRPVLFDANDQEESSIFGKEINVNCVQGDDWKDQKAGVCKMYMVIGSVGSLCTGDLMNNTNQDFKPYILSAAHCASQTSSFEPTAADLKKWQFFFHFEKPSCANSSFSLKNQVKTMVGCTRKAFLPIAGQSDGLLLQLNQEVPADYRVYYNGWDRSTYENNTDIKGLVGIHHPAGDVKKISVLYPQSTLHVSTWTNPIGYASAHYYFSYDEGDTEGGSSGSSIFANKNKLVIGTLTGGGQGTQYYGRLTYHWDKFAEKMGPFLDPKTNGKAFTCEGTYRDDMKPVYPVSDINVINGSNEKEFIVTWKSPYNAKYALDKYGSKCVSYMLQRNGVPMQMKRIYDDGSGVMKYIDKDIPEAILKGKVVKYSVRVSYAFPKEAGGSIGFDSEEAAGMVQNLVTTIKPKSVSLNSQGTGTSVKWSAPLYPQEWSKMGVATTEYALNNILPIKIGYSTKLSSGGEGQKNTQPYTYYIERWTPGILPVALGNDKLSLYVSQLDFIPNNTQVGKNDLYIYLSYDKSVRDNSSYSKQVIQKVTVDQNEVGKWKHVVFDHPIPLDPTNMLQIGFRSTNMRNNPTSLTYMSGSSDGDKAKVSTAHMLYTNYNHYGEYGYTGEAIFPLSFVQAPSVDLNYMAMKVIVTSSFEKLDAPITQPDYSSSVLSIPPVVTGYKVMKDGKEIATTKAISLSYLDRDNKSGEGNYEIVPIYNSQSLDTQLVSKAQMSKVVPTMVESTVTYSGDVADIAVYSMNGERVAFVANVENGGSIDLQTLEPGSYLVVMTTAEGKVEQKIVKK